MLVHHRRHPQPTERQRETLLFVLRQGRRRDGRVPGGLAWRSSPAATVVAFSRFACAVRSAGDATEPPQPAINVPAASTTPVQTRRLIHQGYGERSLPSRTPSRGFRPQPLLAGSNRETVTGLERWFATEPSLPDLDRSGSLGIHAADRDERRDHA